MMAQEAADRAAANRPKPMPRYRHLKRGTTYRVLYEAAKASSIVAALDDMTMDGLVWVRPAIEFFDGRFERIPAAERVRESRVVAVTFRDYAGLAYTQDQRMLCLSATENTDVKPAFEPRRSATDQGDRIIRNVLRHA